MNSPIAYYEPLLRSTLRIMVGFVICLHGAHKLFGVFTLGGGGIPPMVMDTLPQAFGLLELIAGLLLLVGAFVRPVAATLTAEMLAAYLFVAVPNGAFPIRNGGEEAAVNSLLLLAFTVYGAGSLSFDAVRRNRTARTPPHRTPLSSPVLSIIRIGLALSFFQHALEKFFGLPSGGAVPLVFFSRVSSVGVLEFGGGLLLASGLFTRATAFLLSGEMALAYLIAWVPIGRWLPINGGEEAVLFSFAFLWMFSAGPGPWSLDHLARQRAHLVRPRLSSK